MHEQVIHLCPYGGFGGLYGVRMLCPVLVFLGTSSLCIYKKDEGRDKPGPRDKVIGCSDFRDGSGAAYLKRSLSLPFFSLKVPLRWSARPSAFRSLLPVKAPVASLMRPFALSIAPSDLSSSLVLDLRRSPLINLPFPSYARSGRPFATCMIYTI